MSKKKGFLEWLAMDVDLGGIFAFVKCWLIVVTLFGVHWRNVNISLKTKIKILQLVSNKPLNMGTWREKWMYIQKKIWCEDQAHSHRLTFIQKSSSPLVMFYGCVSGKKKKKKISNLLKRMLSWLQKATTWSPDMSQLSCVTWAIRSDPFLEELTLLHLQLLRQILQPTPSPHREVLTMIWCSQVRLKFRWELVSWFSLIYTWVDIILQSRIRVLSVMDWTSDLNLVNHTL